MIRFPPRRILVPLDHSPQSSAAWRRASALARRCGAELEAVYVHPWQMTMDLLPPPSLGPALARSLRARIRRFIGDGPRISILEGDPAERIVHAAKTFHADLIVMGTRGRAGLSRLLLGSTAEGVVRASPVPVLVGRGPVRAATRILAPVNFTSYSEHGFRYAAGVAAALGARLTAMHVDVDPLWTANPRLRLARLIASLPPAQRVRCRAELAASEDPVKAMLRAASRHDLIVLVAHRKSAISDALFGTTAEQILHATRKPLLIVPPPHPARRTATPTGRTSSA